MKRKSREILKRKMRGRRAVWLLLCVLVPISLFSGCGRGVSLSRDYRSHPFRAELAWQEGELSLRGELVWREGSLTLTLNEPDTLRGLTLTRQNGQDRVIWEGLSAEGGMETLLSVLDMALPAGELRVISCDENGLVRGEIGETEGARGRYEAYIWKETGIPSKIQQGERALSFAEFVFLDGEDP